jgi:glycosyltransferase involved in cell wall biosynthesis
MVQISVIIITYNEEKNIGQCLEAVKGIADEIVVLDSFSTDRTREICCQFNVRFYQHPFSGYVEQKNKANEFASFPYVLSLDADEILSDNLKNSILQVKNNWNADGYYFNRLTNYCGKWIYHSDWYPDRKLRMWDTRKGSWDGLLIHEKVLMQPDTSTAFLQGDLLHYSFYSIDQHIDQIKKFTGIMADEQFLKGKRPGVSAIIIKPVWKFFRSYILKLGFLDGYYGFIICIMSAYATFVKYVKTRELFIHS